MKNIIVIGSGISGLSAAISLAEKGKIVTLVSPYPSERAQSVMAAGGINAVYDDYYEDSLSSHIEDTYRVGGEIEPLDEIRGLCEAGPDIVKTLDRYGVVFSREGEKIARRAFGGQSHIRTCFAGAATGKQIVTALVIKCREYESKGLIKRIFLRHFYSALIREGQCFGVLLIDEITGKLSPLFGEAVVMATGGLNLLFGKTTGSTLCDGYATGRLFMQGVTLRNLEFIQYHPTTIETPHKRMLITEAARGEGGRLYYEDNGQRIYFMEEKYGPRGNLMPRDVVSKCIYDVKKQVYLDISFLGEELIKEKLFEVYETCKRYGKLDVTKESIPVYPSVHFFMGGMAADKNHMTNIKNLYVVGEAASKYHGANRLGGNSLLAALYSGRVAAEDICQNLAGDTGQNLAAGDICRREGAGDCPDFGESAPDPIGPRAGDGDCPDFRESTGGSPDFSREIAEEERKIQEAFSSKSKFPGVYIEKEIAKILNENLGITRSEENLKEGIESIDYYIEVAGHLRIDPEVSLYQSIRTLPMLVLSKALLVSALERKESRGAHIREDFPEKNKEYAGPSLIEYNDGNMRIKYDYPN